MAAARPISELAVGGVDEDAVDEVQGAAAHGAGEREESELAEGVEKATAAATGSPCGACFPLMRGACPCWSDSA
eukprot:14345572-Alexandrium_andersonii.AAC.1